MLIKECPLDYAMYQPLSEGASSIFIDRVEIIMEVFKDDLLSMAMILMNA